MISRRSLIPIAKLAFVLSSLNSGSAFEGHLEDCTASKHELNACMGHGSLCADASPWRTHLCGCLGACFGRVPSPPGDLVQHYPYTEFRMYYYDRPYYPEHYNDRFVTTTDYGSTSKIEFEDEETHRRISASHSYSNKVFDVAARQVESAFTSRRARRSTFDEHTGTPIHVEEAVGEDHRELWQRDGFLEFRDWADYRRQRQAFESDAVESLPAPSRLRLQQPESAGPFVLPADEPPPR